MRSPDAFNFLDPETVDDPYPFYAALREHAPIYQVPGTDVYLVSKGPLIEEALYRQDDFSANLTGVLMTGPEGEPQVFDLLNFGSAVDAIANADEPSHSVHRKLLLPHVTPKVVASLEKTVREWAIELIDPLVHAGGGDWVNCVANPLPTRAMALVAGLPLEDVDRLLEWAMSGTEILAGTTTAERMSLVGAKTAEMAAYLKEHLQSALAAPDDQPAPGVIGALARGVKEGLISQSDGVSILVVLAGAGGESTSSLTGSAVRILAEQPALQSELRASPLLIPAFVEEAVRLESSFRGHYRVVRRDTKLGDVELRRGSRIMLLWAAANRDPEIFDNPDSVDIHRSNLSEHLSFGRGVHFCAGVRLARLEARVILEELLARTRSFSLDPQHPPRYVSSIFVRRHAELGLIAEA
ncbi:MAG: cytochrome P450 [Deltaproteobacteria bacterium]|nr:cytochrome P450 [Deltaproteobacteria bacterium]MBW2363036.1 cytochrome P450 [Deltaproteobacteria bacterium]